MYTSDILFTRQRHDADRAGLHYDIRLVQGDKAYSWATKKDIPEPGKSILLYETSVHTKDYALRQHIVIPKGNYGSGTTTLDFVRKARIEADKDKGYLTLHTTRGEKFLLKPVGGKFGNRAWLFKNLSKNPETEKTAEVSPELLAKFTPDVSPDQMKMMGVLEGKYTSADPVKANFFKTDASMSAWPEGWHNDNHPKGWWEWYQNFHAGKRTEDDERQIKRWLSFKARHLAQLKAADPTLTNLAVQPRRRQALLNWGIAPGVDLGNIEKQATHLVMWQHGETGRTTWRKKGETMQDPWFETKAQTYIRKKAETSGNRFLTKIAAKEETAAPTKKPGAATLRPHHVEALEKFEKQPGLLVDHSMGSGKTLLYLKAIERFQKQHPKDPTLIMAPASLTSNVYKEIAKHKVKIDTSRLDTLSYEKAARNADELGKKNYGLVVADEAHKLRNTGTKRHKLLSEIINSAPKRLLGTGTSAYNDVSDIAPLVNLAAGGKVLPEGKTAFSDRYVAKVKESAPLLQRILGAPDKEVLRLKNKRELKDILDEHVHHYDLKEDASAKSKFPSKVESVKTVDMDPEQLALYKYIEGKLPFHLRLKVRMNLPLDKKDATALQAFATGIRQVSNSVNSFMPQYEKSTAKVRAAADSMEHGYRNDKNFRGIAYSNFLDSGLNDYSKELKRRNIPHAVFHGGLNKTQKDELLEAYNKGKVPVLLISSSGAEGLNAKGTKKVQVLEPHFNKSKIDQVVARGIRFESHEHLPVEERKVEVEHYLSLLPKSVWSFGKRPSSIDQYLYNNSETKSEIGGELKDLVKKSAVELVPHSYERAKYKEPPRGDRGWESLKNPAATLKRDGGAFFLRVKEDGTPQFISRRESVRGGYPDRSANLPHLTDVKVPEAAGDVYHVELVHTGWDPSEEAGDSHATVSGVLNSNPSKAIATQQEKGPVRAVLLDVVNPKLPTYEAKLRHLSRMGERFGKPDLLQTPTVKIGNEAIQRLIASTRSAKHEGVIVTSLSEPEDSNVRFKIKHVDTYNLRVTRINQEVGIDGKEKDSMGSLSVEDASGKEVADVGTGFSRDERQRIWAERSTPNSVIGSLIQVKAMPSTANRLRSPVYNGSADGEIDLVSN